MKRRKQEQLKAELNACRGALLFAVWVVHCFAERLTTWGPSLVVFSFL